MSDWTASCVLHVTLVLIFTMLYLPRHPVQATLDTILTVPQPAPEEKDIVSEEVKNRDIFWDVDEGESQDEVKPVTPLASLPEPVPVMETSQEIEEPSFDEEGTLDSSLPEETPLPPDELMRARSAASAGAAPSEKAEKAVRAGEHLIGQPRTHKNLTVFLIRGKKQARGRRILTLREALEQNKVVVHETGDVNELAIENRSAGEHVFVQAGEILKGGKQDRVLAVDMLLAPRSGRKTVPVFCVESDRWQQRAGEDVRRFSSSKFVLATKGLKLAARDKESQDDVWKQVAAAQEKLTEKLGRSVQHPGSRSSLQLTLEDPKVRAAVRAYVKDLGPVIEKRDDVVGFAFAVNGKLNSAEVYSSPELFRKLWPKLLEGAAVEALAEEEKGRKYAPAEPELIKKWFEEAQTGRMTRRATSPAGETRTRETDSSLLFETRGGGRAGSWIHRSYIAK